MIKTKELITDFRTVKVAHFPVIVKDMEVRRVDSYKYLGFTIQHNMTWEAHIIDQCKKTAECIYHLHKLKDFHVDRFFLEPFDLVVIHSILTYGYSLWVGAALRGSG